MPLQLFLTVIIRGKYYSTGDTSEQYNQWGCSATPVFLSLYAENDLRLDKYFAETDEKGFRKNKKAGSNNYLCTFRVGEIYLTAAEAAARLGELSQARTRLLELMRKRYAPEAYEANPLLSMPWIRKRWYRKY
mgnify:CR=1 FL=1